MSPLFSAICAGRVHGGTWLSNKVYNWYAKKQHERVEKKKEIEKNQLLTSEASVDIMNQVEKQKEEYKNLVLENQKLKKELQQLQMGKQKSIEENSIEKGESYSEEEINEIVDRIFNDKIHRHYIQEILTCTRDETSFDASIPQKTINFWYRHDLLIMKRTGGGINSSPHSTYSLSNKGEAVMKKLIDDIRIQNAHDNSVF